MPGLLADENAEGILSAILAVCRGPQWRAFWEALGVRCLRFRDAGLRTGIDDRALWRFCQQKGFLLLTNNRNKKGNDSLEEVIRRDGTPSSLPVLTISDGDRLFADRAYAERAAVRLMEILLDIETLRGSGRLFLP